jgi:hypothetical protein
MHNKRRQNNMGGGSGGGQHRHNNNRPRRFNNNRPQNGEGGNDAASISRTRRNALQSREKYQMMARDALSSGDRVLNEYYLQHADHYHRVLLSLPPAPEEAPRPQYQRNFNQPNGDQPPAYDDHPPQMHPENGAVQADNGPGETPLPSSGHAHGLPSFITQPGTLEAPEE